jgi:hypothetical protein
VKPSKPERKKADKPVPAVIVANALMQENLASELSVLKATLRCVCVCVCVCVCRPAVKWGQAEFRVVKAVLKTPKAKYLSFIVFFRSLSKVQHMLTFRVVASLHTLTNQCGEHLQEVWGIKNESKKSMSPDRTVTPEKSMSGGVSFD